LKKLEKPNSQNFNCDDNPWDCTCFEENYSNFGPGMEAFSNQRKMCPDSAGNFTADKGECFKFDELKIMKISADFIMLECKVRTRPRTRVAKIR